jgi:hypothetical protein
VRPRTGRRLGVVALALALAAGGACGSDDDGAPGTEEELARVLEDDRGMSPERARCVAAQAYARLSEEERASLAGTDPEDLSDEQRAELRTALTPCASIP